MLRFSFMRIQVSGYEIQFHNHHGKSSLLISVSFITVADKLEKVGIEDRE